MIFDDNKLLFEVDIGNVEELHKEVISEIPTTVIWPVSNNDPCDWSKCNACYKNNARYLLINVINVKVCNDACDLDERIINAERI